MITLHENMTVAELIEELRELNPDSVVLFMRGKTTQHMERLAYSPEYILPYRRYNDEITPETLFFVLRSTRSVVPTPITKQVADIFSQQCQIPKQYPRNLDPWRPSDERVQKGDKPPRITLAELEAGNV